MTRHCRVLGGAAGLVLLLGAQQAPAPLEFLGLRPGMPHAAADSVVRQRGGALRCQATREPRLRACSAEIRSPAGNPFAVTASLADDRVGVVLVSGPATTEQVSTWHAELSHRYGEAPVRRQPNLESFQWVRHNQMLRLTVRREGGGLTLSVSLVDGALLDGLPPP